MCFASTENVKADYGDKIPYIIKNNKNNSNKIICGKLLSSKKITQFIKDKTYCI